MKKLATGLLAGAAVLTLSATALPAAQAVQPSGAPSSNPEKTWKPDNRPSPFSKQQEVLRDKALAAVEAGEATVESSPATGGGVVELQGGPRGKSQQTDLAAQQRAANTEYYQFPLDREAQIFALPGAFSDVPVNDIPEPNPRQDNSTYWVDNFDRAHYEEMMNGEGDSLRTYYSAQSSGRFTTKTAVQDWVTVPGTAASYGANDVEDAGGTWSFLQDSLNAWYDGQIAAGKTPAEIEAYLETLDVHDRYDYDGDGDFNEPDGYLDHFMSIHAGMGEEAGGGAQGEDAIWSHRWYANYQGQGSEGPAGNLLGGLKVGDSDIWVGDYIINPENGGLGVFAHEFGHDLGLPDYYDTAGGDNGTGFWTIMSAGSWLGDGQGAGEGIGNKPNGFGPEEKLELGWLDYEEVNPGQTFTAKVGPSQNTYDDPGTVENESDQAVKVNLPDKTTTIEYTTPPQGEHAWWSGRDDGLNNTLTTAVPAGASVSVSADAWYRIEEDYDYLYGEYSTDGGTSWTAAGDPISADSDWTPLTYTYAPAGGAASLFRFRYQTDAGVNEAGVFLDNIVLSVDGTTVSTEDGEGGDNGWVADGWSASTGTDSKLTDYYYLIENRQYVGWDSTLKTGPYNFSEAITRPDWVEFFSYRPGMLVWVVDDAYANNNTSAQPGYGAALPVDARPQPMKYGDGTLVGNRRQPWDAAFGLKAVSKTCLHKQVAADTKKGYKTYQACTQARPGIPTFTDADPDRYWSAANPLNSVKVGGHGVRAQVIGQRQGHLTIKIANPKAS